MITPTAHSIPIINDNRKSSQPINFNLSPKYCSMNQNMSHTIINLTKAQITHPTITIISNKAAEMTTQKYPLKFLKIPSPDF